MVALSALLSPTAISHGTVELFWWLKPGVYFAYLYTLPQPFIFITNNYEYETSVLLINYTVLNVVGNIAHVNLTLTFVNAVVYERCSDVFCPIVEEGVNETLHALLEVDLETLGVYVNNTWVDEWLYLATINQLRGKVPKLIRVPSFTLGVVYREDEPETVQAIQTFYEMLREELGEDLVKCIRDINLKCEGFPAAGYFTFTFEDPRLKVAFFRTQGGYLAVYVKPPPSDYELTIKDYTISGDRIASIDTIGSDFNRSIPYAVELGLLEVERNISFGYRRIYAFRAKFAPLKLYALKYHEEQDDLKCLLYNPSRREVFLVDGLGCGGLSTRIVGYYDYYTGVLLYLNVSWGEIWLMPVQAYTRLLGIEHVRYSPHTGIRPPSKLSAELVLVDTNISFERPVIGGAEGGFNPVHVAIIAAIASIIIVGVKVALSRKARSTRCLPTKAHQ
jgi:hypothetical protein